MQSEIRTSHTATLQDIPPSTPRPTDTGKGSVAPEPHSGRVVKQRTTPASEPCPSPYSPPILPIRSPRRPSHLASTPLSRKQSGTTTQVAVRPMPHASYDLLPSDVSSDPHFFPSAIRYAASEVSVDPYTIVLSAADILSPMSLAFRADSPESITSPEELPGGQVRRGSSSTNGATMANASSPSLKPSPPSGMTKRQYAMHELLSSERAYASDLALIKDIHLPLALGESLV